MLSEEKVFLSIFHRCFRRNFNPVYFQMVSGGPDSHTQQLVKGPVIRSIFNHRVEQVIHLGPIISRKGVPAVVGDSKEEVIIFRDRQTDSQTLHHYIFIVSTTKFIIIIYPQGGRASKDWGGARLQRDGREGAEFAHLHIKDHPRWLLWWWWWFSYQESSQVMRVIFFYQCASKGIVKKERQYVQTWLRIHIKCGRISIFILLLNVAVTNRQNPKNGINHQHRQKKGKLMQGKLESTSDCSKGASYAMTLEPGTAAERSQSLS